MATIYLQERTQNTVWRTESTYSEETEAERAIARIRKDEPTNDDGETCEYRLLASDGINLELQCRTHGCARYECGEAHEVES